MTIDLFLFKTIMLVIGGVAGAIFIVQYFKDVRQNFIREGLIVGITWLVINWFLDFVILIPMSDMAVYDYWIQIGLRYLTIPTFCLMAGFLLKHHATPVT